MKAETKWTITEATRKLSSRGCTIAHNKPITETRAVYIKPNEKTARNLYNRFLRQGNLKENESSRQLFTKKYEKLLRGQRKTQRITIVDAMTVVAPKNQLGIKLLGAVDFMRSKGYSVIR